LTAVTAGAGTGRGLVLDDDVAAEIFGLAAVVIFISVFNLLFPTALPPLAGVAVANSGTVTDILSEL
jgi:hypothetical protein